MESAGRLQPLPASAQEAVAFNTRSSGPVAVPSGRQATPGNQVRPPAANMVALSWCLRLLPRAKHGLRLVARCCTCVAATYAERSR